MKLTVKNILRDFVLTKSAGATQMNRSRQTVPNLAHANGYKLFALGKNGLCLSEADMKQKYYTYGTSEAKCRDGVGISSNSMFVYSLGKHRILWF